MPQAIEASFPERTTIFDPAFGYGKPFGFDAARADPANLFGMYKAAFLQDLQVLNDGGQGDVERFCQQRDGDGTFTEFLNDGPAGGVAEGVENAINVSSLTKHGVSLPSSRAN
jgi:hypothetical protein